MNEKEIRAKYNTCLGSAVNPVLREGNSDRRSAKACSRSLLRIIHIDLNHSLRTSKAYVAHMEGDGDFYGNEKSAYYG